MRSTLINKIFAIVGFIGSVMSIIGFIHDYLEITIPKIIIDFEYLYANSEGYTLILFLFIFLISLFTGYRIKIYNDKVTEKYKEIIDLFKFTLLTKEKFDYKYLSNLIIDIYPYNNKSKINVIFKRKMEGEVLYDTSNYDKWYSKGMDKVFYRNKCRFDWRATDKYFEKREIYLSIKNKENDVVSLNIYGDSKAAFTKRKKKMIKPFLDSIEIFMCAILAQQNEQEHIALE